MLNHDAADELDRFRVPPSGSWEQYFELEDLINEGVTENFLQSFLEDNPYVLVCSQKNTHHGLWVLPEVRLGREYVADFFVGWQNSNGIQWLFVEIERATHKIHTKKGNLSQKAQTPVDQIREWRSWLAANRDYARKPKSEKGLGLRNIRAKSPGLVVIGRREEKFKENEQRRIDLQESNIEIRTWDGILEDFGKYLRRIGKEKPSREKLENNPQKVNS